MAPVVPVIPPIGAVIRAVAPIARRAVPAPAVPPAARLRRRGGDDPKQHDCSENRKQELHYFPPSGRPAPTPTRTSDPPPMFQTLIESSFNRPLLLRPIRR